MDTCWFSQIWILLSLDPAQKCRTGFWMSLMSTGIAVHKLFMFPIEIYDFHLQFEKKFPEP